MTVQPFSGPSKPTEIISSLHGEWAGQEVHKFTLTNGLGWQVDVSEYGATLLSVRVPDRVGKIENVCLCLENLEAYRSDGAYIGKAIGPVANRMKEGAFEANGQRHEVSPNEGQHVLHGGVGGLHQCVFSGTIVEGKAGQVLELRHVLHKEDSGFPGTLTVVIRIGWGADGTLSWVMEGDVDGTMPLNLTHHPYWNLGGDFQADILEHELQVVSSHYAEVNDELIPTGQLLPSRLTPMDFRFRRAVGHALPLLEGDGYDHCLVLDRERDGLFQAAHLLHSPSGRNMTLWTNQTSIQLYTGQGLSGETRDEEGNPVVPLSAVCLEPHAPPGALHHAELGNLMVSPGEKYTPKTLYCFFVSPP